MEKTNLDWMISVDDHVLEPPDLWQKRVARKFRDAAPKLVTDGEGERWVYEGVAVPTMGLSAVVGKDTREFSPEPITYAEMRPGCYDPVSRLEDMNLDGVIASLCFPSFSRFCGQRFSMGKDKELGLECVRAYNDWMIEEWCAAAPGRYIPLVIVPLWDPRAAAKEIERTAALGVTAVAFSENPTGPLNLPSIHDPSRFWDPFLAAAAEHEMTICMHVGSSSQLAKISSDSPMLANMAYGAVRTAGAMLEWLFSGVFQRFPQTRIALSEGSIGWIPYFLQRAEQVMNTQRFWAAKGIAFDASGGTSDMGRDPGFEMEQINIWNDFKDHVYGCFIDDAVGLDLLKYIGDENIMIETDYPHSDSTWPGSRKLAKERLGHLPVHTQYKILRGNAERLFRFASAEAPEVR